MNELQPGDSIPLPDYLLNKPKEPSLDVGDKLPAYSPPISSFSPEGLSDVATQVGRNLAYGVGDIGALPATAAQAVHWTSDAGKRAYDMYLEMTGKAAPGSANAAQAARSKAYEASQTPSERSGNTANVFGYQWPTTKGMETLTQSALNLGTDPAKTTLGEYAGAGARAVPMAIATMGEGLIPKIGYGVGSGVLAHAGERASEDTGIPALGMAGALAGAPLGGAAASKFSNMINPGRAGIRDLANATARDVASGRTNLGAVLGADGKPIVSGTTIGQVVSGPNASRVMGQAGGASARAQSELSNVNENIAQRAQDINGNLGQFVREQAGVTANAPELKTAIHAENSENVNNLYNIAQNHPNAQNMVSPELDRAMTGDTMKNISKTVESHATDPRSKIVVPSMDAAGNQVGGNLLYYDAIGKVLRDKIATASAAGEKAEVARLTGLRSDLLSTLDLAIPEYKTARAAAFDNFAQQGAVETGFNALSERNPFDLHDIMNAYKKSLPQHQDMFRQGLGFALQDLAERQGPQAIQRVFTSPQKASLIQNVLGQDATEAILGRTTADTLLAKTRPIQAQGYPASRQMDIARGSLGAQIGHSLFSGDVLGASATGAAYAGTHLVDMFNHFGNNARAMAILKLAGSSDPKDMQMFYKMVTKDPAMRSTYQSMYNLASKAAMSGTVNAQNTPQNAIQRATGGRVGDHHERLVSRLMTLAERAKKDVNNTTEPLLNVPDATIVKALHVANQAI